DEGVANGRLANLLGALDGAIAAIETEMKDAWRETVVAVITEFGRTARINGTEGTDHGTATVAFLAGGALKGGRVVADWPGLKAALGRHIARPILWKQPRPHVAVERRMRPIADAGDQPVFGRIDVAVLDVAAEILFVANQVFPEPTLPDRAFTARNANRAAQL